MDKPSYPALLAVREVLIFTESERAQKSIHLHVLMILSIGSLEKLAQRLTQNKMRCPTNRRTAHFGAFRRKLEG
jgi:hypothetical protein